MAGVTQAAKRELSDKGVGSKSDDIPMTSVYR